MKTVEHVLNTTAPTLISKIDLIEDKTGGLTEEVKALNSIVETQGRNSLYHHKILQLLLNTELKQCEISEIFIDLFNALQEVHTATTQEFRKKLFKIRLTTALLGVVAIGSFLLSIFTCITLFM